MKDALYSFTHLPIIKGPSCHVAAASPFLNISIEQPCSVSITGFNSSCMNNVCLARLGHANSVSVKHVLHLFNIPHSNKDFEFCNSCPLGKSHRIYASLLNTVYSAHFQLIHSDLWGPSPQPSHGGYTYYITFADAYSKYNCLYLSTKIKAIQSDWG